MTEVLESRPQAGAAAKPVISPQRLAHVVLRSSQLPALVDWYTTVLGATVAFSDGNLAFLAYDDEHHRIAVLNIPGLQRQPDGTTGMHHMAFTYASLSDLVATYERLDKPRHLPELVARELVQPLYARTIVRLGEDDVERQDRNLVLVEELGDDIGHHVARPGPA